MRPRFYFDADCAMSSVSGPHFQTPLIETGNLRYDRQNLPEQTESHPGAGLEQLREAEMDRKRPEPSIPPTQPNASSVEGEPETRAQRLARIRAEIEAGVYETPEKLEIALGRMFGTLLD